MNCQETAPREMCEARFYMKLAANAPNPTARALIMSIAGDEYGRARINAALRCENPPAPACPLNCCGDTGEFYAELEGAIKRELESAGECALMATRADSPALGCLLMSVTGDEYAHARILAALLESHTH